MGLASTCGELCGIVGRYLELLRVGGIFLRVCWELLGAAGNCWELILFGELLRVAGSCLDLLRDSGNCLEKLGVFLEMLGGCGSC